MKRVFSMECSTIDFTGPLNHCQKWIQNCHSLNDENNRTMLQSDRKSNFEYTFPSGNPTVKFQKVIFKFKFLKY